MNELEKLREEIRAVMKAQSKAHMEFNASMAEATQGFLDLMQRCREIERQAGIGSDTNA